MQIKPYTADWLIKKYSLKINQSLCDPKVNLKLGVLYLNYLWVVFKNKEKVIMAYNLGHNAVLKGKSNYKYLNKFIKKYLYYKEFFYGSSVFVKRKY